MKIWDKIKKFFDRLFPYYPIEETDFVATITVIENMKREQLRQKLPTHTPRIHKGFKPKTAYEKRLWREKEKVED